MIQNEKRAVLSLALIMACRMLGMFMLLPVFSVDAHQLSNATPTLIGIALGVYGLTQACLQVPLGSLSDHFGRKKIITLGLVLFALGSLIGGFTDSIYGVIAARALQGTGAVGSTILAMTADLTRDEYRSKSMAMIGLTIGFSFAIALIIGPVINHYWQFNGIFFTTLLLAISAIVLLHTLVPNPPQVFHSSTVEYQARRATSVLKNSQLLRLDLGIFSLHAILTATFIAAPILLTKHIQLSQLQQTLLYLIVLGLAFVLMLPFIIIGEKKRQLKRFFIGAISVLLLCEVAFVLLPATLIMISVNLLLFFTAFTFLEASLPSLVSKISPIKRKGTAMGIYSTAQFSGMFVGGSLGGVFFTHFQLGGLFIFCAALAAIWLLCASSMQHPPYLSTSIFHLSTSHLNNLEKIKQHLSAQKGVAEVSLSEREKLIYIKADQKIVAKHQLRKLLNDSNLKR